MGECSVSADDEIRMLTESWRLLGNDVPTNLLDRGWRVADLEVSDDQPLEWFWPPTAPVGYGGLPEWSDEIVQHRPAMYGRRPTPWTVPTRITRSETGWLVQYGTAMAQQPDLPVEHRDDASLLAELERVEWWPMPVEEARQISMERLWTTTQAAAYDQHVVGFLLKTEPYDGRANELRAQMGKPRPMGDPDTWKWSGDLGARLSLVDAEAWTSAVRSARAGGEGWDTSGLRGERTSWCSGQRLGRDLATGVDPKRAEPEQEPAAGSLSASLPPGPEGDAALTPVGDDREVQ